MTTEQPSGKKDFHAGLSHMQILKSGKKVKWFLKVSHIQSCFECTKLQATNFGSISQQSITLFGIKSQPY